MIPHQVKMANLKDPGFKSSFFGSNTRNTTRKKTRTEKNDNKKYCEFPF